MAEATTRTIVGAFSPAQREALDALGRLRNYRRGSQVFAEGDRSDFVILVMDGRLKVLASTVNGGESVLGIRGPGSLVGELAAFDGGPRTASAIALDPLTVRVITAHEFKNFVSSTPGAAVELIHMLMGRLREGDRRRLEFGAYDATARVAHLLCDLATERGAGRGGEVQVRLAQHEIAGLVGASRESVARALAALREQELVTTGRGFVTVLDLDALRGKAS
jgi:CRP-like cAMP-binding protein